jgi:hypothetical protein
MSFLIMFSSLNEGYCLTLSQGAEKENVFLSCPGNTDKAVVRRFCLWYIKQKKEFSMAKLRWQSLALLGIVVLATLQFGYFGFRAAGGDVYLVAQVVALALGGLLLISLEQRYRKIGFAGVVIAFALYTLLVALYSKPVVEALQRFFER